MSANTFPLLRATGFVETLAMSFLIVPLRSLQSFLDESDVGLAGRKSMWRLFLKRMQHIDCFGKTNRIYRPKCVSVVVFHYFQNSWVFAFSRFCRGVFAAELGSAEGKADGPLHGRWELGDVLDR
jgi:hypothetical protein